MSLINELKQFGLDEKMGKIYLALLELGESKAHEIAHKTGFARPSVYDILEKLGREGLVGSYKKNKIKYFVANDPIKIKKNMQQKEKLFDLLLPELRSKHNSLKIKPKILFFDGLEGIKTVFEDTLSAQDKTLRGILSAADLFKIPGKKFMDDYVARRIKNNFNLLVIRSKPKEVVRTWLSRKEERREVRYSPSNMIFEMTTYIYDDKVGLISTEKENFGMIIQSKEYSSNMRHMFNALWQISTQS